MIDLSGIELPQLATTTDGEFANARIVEYRRQLADQLYGPLLEQTSAQIGQSGIVDEARAQVAKAPDELAARLRRQQSRYGTNMSPAAMQYQQRGMALDNSLRGVQTINDARVMEDEFDQAARRGIINIGSSMLNTAQQGAAQAAGVTANTEAMNEAGRQANRAAGVNAATTLVAAII